MDRKLLVAMIAVLVVASASSSSAGEASWKSLGPFGGAVVEVVVDPQNPATLYAASARFYKSTDGGDSWFRPTSDLPDGVEQLAIDPVNSSVLYALSRGRVHKSVDAGVSWTLSSTGLPTGRFEDLSMAPSDPQTLFVTRALGDGGIYKSVDGAATWTSATGNLDDPSARNLAIDPADPTVLYISDINEIYKTIDGGTTWLSVSTGLPGIGGIDGILVHPADSDTLLAMTGEEPPLYRSINGGASWEAFGGSGLLPGFVYFMDFDPTDPSTLYIGLTRFSQEILSKSIDGGATWVPINGTMGDPSVRDVAVDPTAPDTLYAGVFGQGVFKSTDGGATWALRNVGIEQLDVNTVVPHPTDKAILYIGSQGGVFKSADGGSTWAPSNTGLTELDIGGLVISQANPSTLFAIGEVNNAERRLFKSADAGATWDELGLGGRVFNALAVAADDSVVYLSTDFEIFRSFDGGDNWDTLVSTGESRDFSDLAVDPTDASRVFFVSFAQLGIWESLDYGLNWSSRNHGVGGTFVYALDFDPIVPQVLYTYTSTTLYRTTDSAENWQQVGDFHPTGSRFAVSPSQSGRIFRGSGSGLAPDAVVVESFDGGETWTDYSSGLEGVGQIKALVMSGAEPGRLFVGTRRGVFSRQLAIFEDGFESGDTTVWRSAPEP